MNKNIVYRNITLYHTGTTKEARLLLQDYKGYPRVSVFVKTIKSADRAASMVNFAINKQALYTAIQVFKEILDKGVTDSVTIEMSSPVWEDDKQTDKISKSGTYTMGCKEVDGKLINYVTVENNDGLKFSFKIMPSPYVRLMKDNTLLDDSQVSRVWTKSYLDMLQGVLNLSLEFNDKDATKDTVYSKLMLFSKDDIKENRFLIQDYKNTYRLSVFSKNKEDRKAISVINFAINKHALYVIVRSILHLTKEDREDNFTVDLFSPVWVNDARTDDIKKVGRVTVGKKKVGDVYLIYLTIENMDGLKFSFKIMPSPYVKVTQGDKEITGTELSNIWSESYATMLLSILNLQLDTMDGSVNKDNITKSKIINTDNIDKELSDIQ